MLVFDRIVVPYSIRYGYSILPGMFFQRLLEIDQTLTEKLRIAEKPGLLRQLAIIIGHTGDSWYWALLLLAVLFLAPPVYKHWALTSLLAVLVGAALVITIKFLIRRKRPEGELGQIYRKTDPHSFPSGHAVRAIMLGVIALGIAPLWLGIVLILWGPLIGLARIAIGVHYLSDVLAGWVLGAFLGWLAVDLSVHLPLL